LDGKSIDLDPKGEDLKGELKIWRTKMQARVLARVQGKVLGFNLLQMNPN
jgi:hypothetical protein